MAAGYRLADDAVWIWKAFERVHQQHGLAGALEIPMESFARAVEIVLKESEPRDAAGLRPDEALWEAAVRSCGYIQSRMAVGEAAIALG